MTTLSKTLLLSFLLAVITGSDDRYLKFDPSDEHPHGRPHPDAPPELAQFDFMIGEFEATDQFLQRDGTWLTSKGVWNASYFLNGLGIQDRYENQQFVTSNIRIFDPDASVWKVTFFKMPGYASGVWEGKKEGDRMVMRQFNERPDGTQAESRLTFFDITEEGYEWQSENIVDGQSLVTWKSSCRRVK
ncbi:MAG: hypothetical protein RL885_31975 [Planctomycetota bacterium]